MEIRPNTLMNWENRAFQTPPRGDPNWRETFQDMNALVGYLRILYNSDRTEATLNFTTRLNPRVFDNYDGYTVYYYFGDTKQDDPIFTITADDWNDGTTLPCLLVKRTLPTESLLLLSYWMVLTSSGTTLPSTSQITT